MALSKITNASVTDSTLTTTKLATPNLGRRNLVINGAMQVAQRGTSFSGFSTSAYHLDRFRTGMGDTTARFTVTQATAGLNGFANSFKYNCTTAEASLANGNARLFFHTRFEGQDLQQIKKGTSDAEKITVSFYVKSNKTGTYTLELNDQDNTRSNSQTYTISSSNTWERKIITFDADTTGAFDNDNALSLIIYWHLIAGTNYQSGTFNTSWATSTTANRVSSSQVNIGDSTDNTWEITGIQMEVGEQATPFEHKSFGEELALCQRYYCKTDVDADADFLAIGNIDGSTYAQMFIRFPVTMRTSPTSLDQSGTASDYELRVTSNTTCTIAPLYQAATKHIAYFNIGASGHGNSNGQFCFCRSANANAFIAFNAEL